MRVLVATAQVPFVRGGAEIHAEALIAALRRAGHEADLVTIPFKWYPAPVILDHMLAAKLLDLGEVMGRPVDRVIALRFPTYFATAPRKTLWLQHLHRAAYDMWNHDDAHLDWESNGATIRAAVVAADRRELAGLDRRFAISRNVADRLERFHGTGAECLYPPLDGAERFHCRPAEPFVFFPSRISRLKRQPLAIEAMVRVPPGLRLVIAGSADAPEDTRALEASIAASGDADRITFVGAISEEEKIELYARCSAVLFPPFDEDYGYVTAEAMQSAKPVVTCGDSGGPLELVVPGETGYVVAPEPEALAQAITQIAARPDEARRMGEAGRVRLDALDINWPDTIERLLA